MRVRALYNNTDNNVNVYCISIIVSILYIKLIKSINTDNNGSDQVAGR